jgi:hypothetical protein
VAIVLVSVSAPASLMLATPTFASAAQADRYSVTASLGGKMIDDPAAAPVVFG